MSLIYLKKLTGKAMAGLLAVLLLFQPATGHATNSWSCRAEDT